MNQNKVIALVVNCIVPGAGTIMAGKKKEGVIQIILVGVALLLIMALLGILLGISLTFGV